MSSAGADHPLLLEEHNGEDISCHRSSLGRTALDKTEQCCGVCLPTLTREVRHMSIHIRRHGEGCGQHGWPDFDRPAAPPAPGAPPGSPSGRAFRYRTPPKPTKTPKTPV